MELAPTIARRRLRRTPDAASEPLAFEALHAAQARIVGEARRFNVLCCGRRFNSGATIRPSAVASSETGSEADDGPTDTGADAGENACVS